MKKRTISALLALSMCFGMFAPTAVAAGDNAHVNRDTYRAEGTDRTILNFNSDWGFYQGDLADAQEPTFDDSAFAAVTVPHTMRLEKKNAGNAGSVYQGIGWYRRYFTIDDAFQGKIVNIDFDGVMIDSEVYLNGEKLYTRNGGYVGFSVDVTDKLKWDGQTNVLAVRVSSVDSPDTPPGKPLASLDFHYYGGIYRDVRMRITDTLCITDALQAEKPASGGVFVSYEDVSEASATVNVTTHVQNRSTETAHASVQTQLVDDQGNIVAQGITDGQDIAAAKDADFVQQLMVTDPVLWHPDQPYLYKLVSTVRDGEVKTDSITTKVGVRTIDFRADGFYINGEKLYLRGANRHQSYMNVGDAASESMQVRDAIQMKENGFNSVRATHYPQSPAFLSACDELGLLVVECQPGWQNFTNTPTFFDRTLRDTREMIRRDRNHPSVILWETSLNETGYSETWAEQATAAAHEEYPGDQMFTAADFGYHGTLYDVCYKVVDYAYGTPDRDPGKPFLTREWGDWGGAGQASRKNGEAAQLNNVIVREKQLEGDGYPDWGGLDANERIGGYFLWSWNDYARGSQPASLVNGTVDIDRYEKYNFYWLRSMQSARDPAWGPMVFAASAYTESSPLNVTVYSNCDSVKLYQNDTLIGEQTRDEAFAKNSSKGENSNIKKKGGSPIFKIKLPAFAAGKITVEGILGGEVAATHTVRTPGAPARIEIEVKDRGIAPVADGSDLVPVYFKVVDENGTVVPTATNKLQIAVSGEGALVGENIPRIGVQTQKVEAGIGSAFVRTGHAAGNITVTAVDTEDETLTGTYTFVTQPTTDVFVADGAHTPWANGMDVFEEEIEIFDNLAMHKPVTASSQQTGNLGGNLVDDDEGTRWCASGGSFPQWVQVDLEAVQAIAGFQMLWEKGASNYAYEIQTSFDGENWVTAVDSADIQLPSSTLDTQMKDVVARYVRLHIGACADGWASLFELRVLGSNKPLDELLPIIGDEAVEDLTSTDTSPAGRGVDTLRDGETLIGTGWLSQSNTAPQSVTLSFQTPQTVVANQIHWEKDSSQYSYTLELSTDGETWQTAIDDTVGGQSFQPVLLNQIYTDVRFARVTITNVSAGGAPVVGMAEWRIFGMGQQTENKPAKSFAYISDLDWKSASVGYGKIAKDASCNGSSITLKVDDETREFSKGISGDHAEGGTVVTYDLEGLGATAFTTYVGIDTNAGKNEARTIFTIAVDGDTLYTSGVLTRDGGAEFVEVALPQNAKELTLRADWDAATANGQYNAHACWGDAKLLRPITVVASVETLDDVTVARTTPFYRLPLPETVQITLDDESTHTVGVQWKKGSYDAATEGRYTLTGTLVLGDKIGNDNAISASIDIVVEDAAASIPVQSVALNMDALTLYVNTGAQTAQLIATVSPDNATNQAVRWSSDTPTVATVDENGWVTAHENGEAVITVTTVDGEKTATCAVTVRRYSAPSGGGGGGSAGTPTEKTETEKHEDGSTTVTVTDSVTGTVTKTTTKPNGDKTVVETKKDGTVTESVTNKDGYTSQTVTRADGSVTRTVTDAAGVKTEMNAPAQGDTLVKVTLPKGTASAKITVPIKDSKAGMVAVVVGADGTEQVLQTAVLTKDGMVFTVAGDITVKLVDKSKSFADVANTEWYADSVAFATARGLFGGMSDTAFSPNTEMTRAMLLTVLYRLDGAKNGTDGETWYSAAVAWAVQQELSDGANPNGAISREQLATMLYRYAGSPVPPNQALEFTDAGKVSDWAQDEMRWAVSQGILAGKSDGVLDPAGNATRAEVATMLKRFVESRV